MLALREVSKILGDFHLERFNLELERGEYFVLLGPSGVGKTVLLELIAGILVPDKGRVFWGDEDITRFSPERRDFALVYQDYALFPHLNVASNLSYGLRARGVEKGEIQRRLGQLADLVGIRPLLERRPTTLSGGECQRVALARALAVRPRLLLLDEPLAALDPPTRMRLRKELQRIHRETGVMCLHVTHDAEEALLLGQRIGVMLGHKLHQVGTAEELFRAPSDRDVAEFLGLRNVFSIRYVEPGICAVDGVTLYAQNVQPEHKHAWVKPEEIVISRDRFASSARNQIQCRVMDWDPGGVFWAVHMKAQGVTFTALLTHASLKELRLEPNQNVYATFNSSAVHCF